MAYPVMPLGFFGSQGDTPDSYRISRSLRFNSTDNAYLSRTPSTTTDRKTWTYSTWIKRTKLSSASTIFFGWNGSNTSTVFQFTSSDNLELYNYAGAYYAPRLITNQVLRDLSAWYHIVLVWDANNSTSSDRQRIYINGQRVTSFSTESYSNDIAYGINVASYPHGIGGGAGSNFDGYMAETNFIDGQALTPSSFGETDAVTGRWKAKAFTGTYGINGFYLPFTNNTSTSGNSVLYSENFNAAMYTKNDSSVTTDTTAAPNGATTADTLTENTATATHRLFFNNLTYINGTTYTTSIYVKANTRTAVALENWNGTVANYCYADLSNGTVISGSHASAAITSVGSGWYRISVSNVGTGAASCGSALYLKNNNTSSGLSYTGNGSSSIFIWGMQTEAFSTLGPYLSTNGTAIGSTLLVGADSSVTTGGYNSWIVNNFSVNPGADNDSLVDSPTNYGTDTGVGGEVRGNYCTFNALKRGSTYANLSNGNLTIAGTTGGAGQQTVQGTIGMSSGKWYAEAIITTVGAESSVGIARVTQDTSLYVGNGAFSYGYYFNGNKYNNSSPSAYGASYTSGNVIGIAFDADLGTLTFYKNGISQGTAFTGLTSGPYVFEGHGRSATSGNQNDWNFGQRPFVYAAPTGFKALCTTNLPTPIIKKPNSYMDVVTYIGNNASRSITGLSFSPDLVWIKSRTNATWNFLFDSVRGATKWLASNQLGAEATNTTSLTSFNSDGFSLSTDPAPDTSTGWNANLSSQVAWAWDAGSSSVSNTSGSITSTVRANPQAGVSICTFNVGASGAKTFGHGLTSAPKMVIVKSRTSALGWCTYHASVITATNQYIQLNTTAAILSVAGIWGSALPTSSVVGIGSGTNVNANDDCVAYCFAEIEGYSKFGSYTGNASTDGPFIYCGFRPRFIMIKRTDSVEPWIIKDTARSIYNGYDVEIYPNYPNIEGGPYSPPIMDYLSNGFKLRSNTSASNGSGNYIFVAFAESPFKYSMAR